MQEFVEFVRGLYKTNDFIALHAPVFSGKEKEFVLDTIDSTFVSSVGAYVDRFEEDLRSFTKAGAVTATVNGTSALHAALYFLGVRSTDVVVTQPLTFVATCNAISLLGAEPNFVDIDSKYLGMSAKSLESYFEEFAELDEQKGCIIKATGQKIKAVLPMHTFGHPVDMDGIISVCNKFMVPVVEDAAESLGSYYKGRHTGTIGDLGILSFNGNKIITTGGGGAILSQNAMIGKKLKHLTSTAKQPHKWAYYHDMVAFNYRMPNINAALGSAQMESLSNFLKVKRRLSEAYQTYFQNSDYEYVKEPGYGHSNYWLNNIVCPSMSSRDAFLEQTNDAGVMTRPVWQLMHKLPMYEQCRKGDLVNAEWAAERLVSLPSSVSRYL